MSNYLLGIDIGGTKCAVCLGQGQGTIIDKIGFPTNEPKGPQQTIDQLLAAADTLMKRHHAAPRAVGISCGSPLDPELGIVQSPANLQSWVDVPIVNIFQERFGIPAFLENDANAGALAEFSFGAGRGFKNIIFLTFGTGMGAGLILDGRLYRGTTTYAGEVGHIRLAPTGPIGCRKPGSFEGFCSGGGIAQIAKAQLAAWIGPTSLPPTPTARDVGLAAQTGDKLALQILEITGHHLGLALAVLADVLNPQVVVIGSIFVRCEKFIRPAMDKALHVEALEQTYNVLRVVPAQLEENIGDYAALAIAYNQLGTLDKR